MDALIDPPYDRMPNEPACAAAHDPCVAKRISRPMHRSSRR
jgi:hypothetical protein